MNRRRFLSWCAAIPAFFGVGAKASPAKWKCRTHYGELHIDPRFVDPDQWYLKQDANGVVWVVRGK